MTTKLEQAARALLAKWDAHPYTPWREVGFISGDVAALREALAEQQVDWKEEAMRLGGLNAKHVGELRKLEAERTNMNLNCKSVQARLATSWGYVKAEPVNTRSTSEYSEVKQEPFDMDDHPPHRLCECRKCMEYFTPLPDCDAFAASGKPLSEQAEQEPVARPFECWSTNDGYSWFEHPADAQLIYDVLGDDPKVGDEFEVWAGWNCVTATYQIASKDGDDFEVKCVSHPNNDAAPIDAKAIRAEALEEAAKVCEEMWAGGYGPSAITAAIRSRSDIVTGVTARGEK